jgi:2-keto-myo-inositol isomerase
MELGLNGATTGPSVGLQADIALAGAAGFHFVELRDDKVEAHLARGGTLDAARDALARAGVRCASLNALEDATLAEGAAWDARLARWETLCRWAQGLGTDLVIAVPSRRPAGMDLGEVTRRTRLALGRLATAAGRYGVRTGFEFLGFGWCSVNTLAQAVEVVRGLDASGVGLVVDTFHCHVGGVDPGDLRRIDPGRLFLIHLDDCADRSRHELTDADRVLPGAGVMPLVEMIRALATAGYAGGYSVELFRPEYWAWDPALLARRAFEHARAVVGGALSTGVS